MPANRRGNANGTKNKSLKKMQQREEKNLVLWKAPVLTLYYFTLECFYRFAQLRFTLLYYKYSCLCALITFVSLAVMSYCEGPHSEVVIFSK